MELVAWGVSPNSERPVSCSEDCEQFCYGFTDFTDVVQISAQNLYFSNGQLQFQRLSLPVRRCIAYVYKCA